MSDMSFRIRHRRLGGHVHVAVWSSEFGPDTTHGCNGTLIFRETEWSEFRQMLYAGRDRLDSLGPSIVFISELDTDLVPMATNKAPKRGEGCCKAAVDSEGFTHDHAEWFTQARNHAKERDALHNDLIEARQEVDIVAAENLRLRRELDALREQHQISGFLGDVVALAADDLEGKVRQLIQRVERECNEHMRTLHTLGLMEVERDGLRQDLAKEQEARRRITGSHNALADKWIGERDQAEARLKRAMVIVTKAIAVEALADVEGTPDAAASAEEHHAHEAAYDAALDALLDAVKAYRNQPTPVQAMDDQILAQQPLVDEM